LPPLAESQRLIPVHLSTAKLLLTAARIYPFAVRNPAEPLPSVTRVGIYYAGRVDPVSRIIPIKLYRFADAKTIDISHFDKQAQLQFSVSPDERWFAWTQIDLSVDDLLLIENFRSRTLGRRTLRAARRLPHLLSRSRCSIALFPFYTLLPSAVPFRCSFPLSRIEEDRLQWRPHRERP
jgi:hypothetical protein